LNDFDFFHLTSCCLEDCWWWDLDKEASLTDFSLNQILLEMTNIYKLKELAQVA